MLNIAMQDVRNVWLLNTPPVKLSTALHQGLLCYRLPKSGKRISYLQLKKGLVKQNVQVAVPYNLLPF